MCTTAGESGVLSCLRFFCVRVYLFVYLIVPVPANLQFTSRWKSEQCKHVTVLIAIDHSAYCSNSPTQPLYTTHTAEYTEKGMLQTS